jgi:hypothetical protein
MYDIEADLLVQSLSCLICVLLPLVFVGVEVGWRPNPLGGEIPSSRNVVEAEPLSQFGPGSKLRLDVLTELLAREDP